jgi:hypothetical protein
MTPRTIVTSQPDVACDVCERRLLRGEQPDVFIAAGRRLIVCELCAPRATHEGWLRETDSQSLEMPPLRPRRGRNLLDRLRVLSRPEGEPVDGVDGAAQPLAPFDGDPGAPEHATPVGVGRIAGAHGDSSAGADDAVLAAEPTYVELAVEVFNGSEYPRRIAGVARSLGVPEVSVRSAEHLSSVVVVVVAWELCWYRYEVDLSEVPPTVTMLEQGSELTELRHDDRLANALAAESGALVLAGGPPAHAHASTGAGAANPVAPSA